MSVSPPYLEATVIAAAARERGDLEAFVNISQMTVSQMSLRNMTEASRNDAPTSSSAVRDFPAR
jgi:hypothetical protein